jgi:hypothetical protein
VRSVDECVLSIARQIARGKLAATADTRVLAPSLSQVHSRDRLQMERANGEMGYSVWSPSWCKWNAPRWILRDFDLAGILCPARNSTLYLRPTLVRATSGAIRSPHASLLPHALLSPCSLPAALAYLTLSFLMPSILCLSAICLQRIANPCGAHTQAPP